MTISFLYNGKLHIVDIKLTGRLAQLVERRTREHNVSGLYKCGFESPAGQLKIINCLSDETLNRGPV